MIRLDLLEEALHYGGYLEVKDNRLSLTTELLPDELVERLLNAIKTRTITQSNTTLN